MTLRETLGRFLGGRQLPPPEDNTSALMEEYQQQRDNLAMLTERLAELELTLEDKGWLRLTGATEREFSRDQLTNMIAKSRIMYLKNPLVNRAVNLQAYYVWGQGFNVKGRHALVDEVVQRFADDVKNKVELTSHQARTLKETDLQVYGNLFFVLFSNAADGLVNVRTIPVDEVTDIVSNPEDRKDVWYYKREWMETALSSGGQQEIRQRVAYYPDWRYQPRGGRSPTVGDKQILWEMPVYHVKVGGLADMRFGVPEVYQALDWALAYKNFLEDWATIVKAYAVFAWALTAKGGPKGVQAAKAKLGTTLGVGGIGAETNPPPLTGSTFIGAEGYKMTPMRTAGATTSADDGRRLLLMVCAAMGLPESFFGDVSVGTLATAKSLDRPTELKFRDRQMLWTDIFRDILGYAVERAASAPGSKLGRNDEETGEPIDRHVDVGFPPILQHDIKEAVGAIVSAATLDGKPTAGTIPDPRTLTGMLLTALGEDDVDEIMATLFPEEEEESDGRKPAHQAFTEALVELRNALAKVTEAK